MSDETAVKRGAEALRSDFPAMSRKRRENIARIVLEAAGVVEPVKPALKSIGKIGEGGLAEFKDPE